VGSRLRFERCRSLRNIAMEIMRRKTATADTGMTTRTTCFLSEDILSVYSRQHQGNTGCFLPMLYRGGVYSSPPIGYATCSGGTITMK
jgi:hypothetical protein